MIDMQLVQLLADGHFHSGERLGSALHLSRAAVWNRIAGLRDAGVSVHSVPGKGYRIPGGLDLLDAGIIAACMDSAARAGIGDIEVLATTGSTNDVVMTRVRNGEARRCVVFAEQQTAGRGRRGKVWTSPFAANIYLSMSWEFPGGLSAVDGLSLVTGIALCELLTDFGLTGIGLKWPNDLLADGRKFGGILIEVNAEAGGPCSVVVGVGLNVGMSMREVAIDQPWTDLRSLGLRNVSRNQLAAQLLCRLVAVLGEFSNNGLAAFLSRWRAWDVILGRQIEVRLGGDRIAGIAAGIDQHGALLVDTVDGRKVFHGGEVSVRSAR